MLVINPAFLDRPPSRQALTAVLAVLLWAALPLVVSLPFSVSILFGLLWLGRLAMLHIGLPRLRWPALVLLMAASAALVWSQLGTVVGREGGIALLLLMVMLKAFEGGSQRDWQVLLLAMLFLIGSAVLFDQSLFTGLWLVAALAAISSCFAALGGLPPKEAVRSSAQALLLTLPLAAVLFVGVPRKSEPFWRIPQADKAQAKTGLSDTMQPGSISELAQTNELVANITFTGRQPQMRELYWRAMIMADFDGIGWKAVENDLIDTAQAPDAERQPLRYEMILRDQNGIIPALDYPPAALPRGMSARLGDVVRTRSREGLRRVALSAGGSDLLPHRLNSGERALYLRLPPTGNSQTRALARQLAEGTADERETAAKMLDYYRSQRFVYTLRPPQMLGRDSIDQFMFQARQGFCEHYAQSFVVMMRAAGIPARVVTGYQGGDFQPDGGFWQLRSKQAHAWAEIWLSAEQAWWRVDPTAAVAEVRLTEGLNQSLPEDEQAMVAEEPSGWRAWAENGQYYWQQWVVNYDQSKQNSLFAALGLGGFTVGSATLALAGGGLLALLPVAWWWQRGRRREQDPLYEGFMLMKTVLLDGDETAPAVTAAELRTLMHENGIGDETLDTLLTQYEHWLFAAENLPPKTAQRVWLGKVRKALRPYYPAADGQAV